MNLKKIGKVFTSKLFWDRALVLGKKNLPGRDLTKVEKHCCGLAEYRQVTDGLSRMNQVRSAFVDSTY
jgi:hypothetical protein